MTALLITAFITGLFGSLHCAGMCGPIALSFNMQGKGNAVINALLYNASRIFAYALIGMLIGSLGVTFHYVGLQQVAAISMGVMILIIALITWLGAASTVKLPLIKEYTNFIQRKIAQAFKSSSPSRVVALGFFNGLLPCGLVYLAVAGAIASGNTFVGAAYMIIFGLGTLPLMFIFSAFGNWLGFRQRLFIRKYLPVFSITIAILLILRGLNLGIPYVSPQFTHDQHNPVPADQHCSPAAQQEAHILQ